MYDVSTITSNGLQTFQIRFLLYVIQSIRNLPCCYLIRCVVTYFLTLRELLRLQSTLCTSIQDL